MKQPPITIDTITDRGLFAMLTDAEAGAVIKTILSLPVDDPSLLDDRAPRMLLQTLATRHELAKERADLISQKRRAAISSRWAEQKEPQEPSDKIQDDKEDTSDSPSHPDKIRTAAEAPSDHSDKIRQNPSNTSEYKCIQVNTNHTNHTNVSQKENEKEKIPPTPPIKEKEKEKPLPPFSKENGPMPPSAAQLRDTMSNLLARYATGTITPEELDRLRTQKRNGNLHRLGLRWDEQEEPKEPSKPKEPSDPSDKLRQAPTTQNEPSTTLPVGKEQGERPPKRFTRPTLDEVRRFVTDQNLNVDPEAFIDYYTSVGWKVGGKAPMKSWKAAARNWHRSEYKKQPPQTTTSAATEQAWRALAVAPQGIDLDDLDDLDD